MIPQCIYENYYKITRDACEPHVCATLIQPGNTWSNLGYIAVGLIIFFAGSYSKRSVLALFPWIIVLIGVGSFLNHALRTDLGQMMDIGSMMLLSSYLVLLNINRLRPISNRTLYQLFILLAGVGVGTMYALYEIWGINIGILFFGAGLSILLGLESVLWARSKPYQLHFLLFGLLPAAAACFTWTLDYFRVWCHMPTVHVINGHVMWHLLTAVSFFFIYKFYRQFDTVTIEGKKKQR
ncbi:MAG: ceramidase domain-containing protein [Patescibacteria group bacterium]|nr:ceramidase domain-containing protein [Patescibacteria group bacterium]MDD5715937.1 ceramidase domain-containing protein [Patescibacteria group bacterium]